MPADIPKPEGLDWVRLRQEVGIEDFDKSDEGDRWSKVKSKFFENPLVPIGAAVTTGALTYGLISLRRGDVKRQQQMMRLRVFAQCFTVVVAMGGIILTLPMGKRNLWGLLEKGEEIKYRNVDSDVAKELKKQNGGK